MQLEPGTEEEVAIAVREARASKAPLRIEGGGTRSGFGRPSQAARTLSLKKLSGITLYEPSEMVIGAWTGTPLAELQKALDEKGQMLAFEPPDYRTLYGSSGEPSIGAVAACALAGPRRVMAGGARDSLIGVRFVTGRGEIIKNGGRVMKNVTGLDLVKLQAGAFGTLGVLTEVIFRVVPKPAAQRTICLIDLPEERTVELLCKAMGSPFEPTGAGFVPAGMSSGVNYGFIRLEGFKEQLDYRLEALRKFLGITRGFGVLPDDLSTMAWAELRDVTTARFAVGSSDAVWRISLPPTKSGAAVAAIRAQREAKYVLDWSGGLIWLATPEDGNAGASLIQSLAAEAGGHATFIRGSDALRASTPVFQPLAPAIQKLQAGLKASFDPDGILNPGRMYAGL
jgi:glycolate oxidase FAD binding subunit